MIQTGTLQPPKLSPAAKAAVTPPPTMPSRERGNVRRTRRHQERLVADWLRSLAPRR